MLTLPIRSFLGFYEFIIIFYLTYTVYIKKEKLNVLVKNSLQRVQYNVTRQNLNVLCKTVECAEFAYCVLYSMAF